MGGWFAAKACAMALVFSASGEAYVGSPVQRSRAPMCDGADGELSGGRQECCKVCHKGKACGDSCIARSKACHKPRGCACDG